jgi:alpha-amylase/alpha-mannosidase (GH57 family)
VSRVHLVILWHMHQPQYRDPSTGSYFLPWTRLHALKDYWGMVKILEEFPRVHMTFNMVPSLTAQIEEYAGGKFREPWFELAFTPAESLAYDQRREILERAFQVNHEHLMSRWPRFVELYKAVQLAGTEAAKMQFGLRDWRDLQALSQLAWMDEEYLENDPVVAPLSRKGEGYTESDKAQLRAKQLELLQRVLPEYRRAAERGQIEISTTPFYHPILPLICDTEIARVANPHTPLPHPPFRQPEDAREQLVRSRAHHERTFGRSPAGLWPSEGSVSNQALEMAAALGFRWYATDEGVLGRSRNIGFWRDATGYPQNAEILYSPWNTHCAGREITGFFRDHYLSDLVGFVYSRIDAAAAASDLHRRIRAIGERISTGRPATVTVILDGENAWEYYPKNGRDFLRLFYGFIERDPEIRALTASEALAAAGDMPTLDGIFPGSWINANFDVWIGHAEDVRAWELLGEAREVYARAVRRREQDGAAPSTAQLARAFESVLAAEGSDWNWWYGPEHGSANDAEFDALYRSHLTEIYKALSLEAPDSLAQPIKRRPERGWREPPGRYLEVQVDGRESSYFEWMGAGYYAGDPRSGALHGRAEVLTGFAYGFGPEHLYIRVNPVPGALAEFPESELRLTLWDTRETRVTLRLRRGALANVTFEQGGVCPLHPESQIVAAVDKILEVSLARDLFNLRGRRSLLLSLALWEGGLPLAILPSEGFLEIALGEDAFAWPLESADPVAQPPHVP